MREIKHLKTPSALLDVVSYDEYCEHKDLYANARTAIEVECNGEIKALPYKKKGSSGPGVYDEGIISFIVEPNNDDDRFDQKNIINLSDVKDSREYYEKQKLVKELEAEILTNPDNVTKLPIGENDTEEMIGLKESLNAKNFDFDKYADRFGSNFPNEKRLIKGEKISIDKLKNIAEKTDIEVEIIFRDVSPDIPNPIGREIRKVITKGGIVDDLQ